MNPGSYYLYEYESCCRRRNLGFLQISSHNYSYLLTLHVKNLPIVPGEQLEVYAFILENQTLTGSPVALLQCSVRTYPHNWSFPGNVFHIKELLNTLMGLLFSPSPKIDHSIGLPPLYLCRIFILFLIALYQQKRVYPLNLRIHPFRKNPS